MLNIINVQKHVLFQVFLKIIEPCLVGFDKEGNIVRYAATGRVSNTGNQFKCY